VEFRSGRTDSVRNVIVSRHQTGERLVEFRKAAGAGCVGV